MHRPDLTVLGGFLFIHLQYIAIIRFGATDLAEDAQSSLKRMLQTTEIYSHIDLTI